MNTPQKIELIETKPTYILVLFLDSGEKVKMSKRFVEKRIDAGIYELANPRKLRAVI